MLKRELENRIFSDIIPQKVVLLLGTRRVGKTVIMEKIIKQFGEGVVFLNGEDFTTLEVFSSRTISSFTQLFQGVKLLAIDEAQNIPDIGNILKLIVDHVKGLSVIVSGSSSFDLFNMAGEPLVGRSSHYNLFPFSLKELSQEESRVEAVHRLEERLIYGMYPELIHISDFN